MKKFTAWMFLLIAVGLGITFFAGRGQESLTSRLSSGLRGPEKCMIFSSSGALFQTYYFSGDRVRIDDQNGKHTIINGETYTVHAWGDFSRGQLAEFSNWGSGERGDTSIAGLRQFVGSQKDACQDWIADEKFFIPPGAVQFRSCEIENPNNGCSIISL